MKYPSKEEYVYRTTDFKMSKDKMASVLYAGIKTCSKFTTLWSLSDYEDRKIEKFESISQTKLIELISIKANNG